MKTKCGEQKSRHYPTMSFNPSQSPATVPLNSKSARGKIRQGTVIAHRISMK
jgi:hypothetical protein